MTCWSLTPRPQQDTPLSPAYSASLIKLGKGAALKFVRQLKQLSFH
jgi:hypothetical protein